MRERERVEGKIKTNFVIKCEREREEKGEKGEKREKREKHRESERE